MLPLFVLWFQSSSFSFPLFLCVILTHSHTLSLTHASTHTHTHPCTHAHTACFIAFAHSSKTISGQLKTGAGFDFARPKSFNMMMVTFGLNGSETFAELNYFFYFGILQHNELDYPAALTSQ